MCKMVELLLIPNPWHPSILGDYGVALLGGDTDAESGSGMNGKAVAGVAIPAALDASEIRFRQVSLASGLSPLSLCLSLLCE